MDNQDTDEILMLAFCEGNVSSFETLMRRYQNPVYNYILRSVRDVGRAEELAQEVFLRVIRAKSRYQGSAKFTTFLYTIVRNLCVDESRRAKFRNHLSLDGEAGDSYGRKSHCIEHIEANQISVEDIAQASRIRKRLAQALEELPADQREVFILRQITGLPFREIGEIIQASENTAKSRMRYALEKLQQSLADLEPIVKGTSFISDGQKEVQRG